MRRWVLAAICATACKVEDVRELAPEPAPERIDERVIVRPDSVPVDEETSLVEAELRRQLSLLTSGYLGGRRPGSEGATLTAGHLERTMLEVGLSPAGVGGGWRQPVVVRIRATDDGTLELPGTAPDAEPHVLRHGEEMVLARAEGAGAWTSELAIVDAGFGITAPDQGRDDYAGVDVKDKLVLVRDGAPPEFDPSAAADYGSIEYKLARARRVGAAGCLVATGSLRRESAWTERVARWQQPRVDSGEEPDDAMPPPDLFGLLSAEAEASIRAWLAASESLEPRPRARAAVSTSERTAVDPNIIGRIPGRDRPQEVVVVLAHWDAGGTDAALPDGGAALDNASGVAVLLAAARKSADWVRRGRMPARSIAFVATAADTLDLAGSRALFEAGTLRRSDIVAVIALDALAVQSGGPNLAALGLDASSLGEDVRKRRPAIRTLPPGGGPHSRVGHRPALAAEIAAIALTNHDPATPGVDVFTPGASVAELADDVDLVFDLVWSLAESDRMPALAPTPSAAELEEPADE